MALVSARIIAGVNDSGFGFLTLPNANALHTTNTVITICFVFMIFYLFDHILINFFVLHDNANGSDGSASRIFLVLDQLVMDQLIGGRYDVNFRVTYNNSAIHEYIRNTSGL